MNINTRDLSFVNFNGQEMQWLKYNNLLVWEAWKELVESGVLPLTLKKCKGVDLVDYKIYGNSVQNGAPSTTNPVEIQSVGDKTRNLLDLNIFNCTEQTINGLTFTPIGENKIHVTGTATDTSIRTQYRGYCSTKEMQLPAGTYIISGSTSELDAMVGVYSNLTNSFIANISNKATTLTEDGYAYYFLINISAGTTRTFDDVIQVQVEEGSTATEYEPYGYKIPVKVSNGTEKITTNVYLDEPLRKTDDVVDILDFSTGTLSTQIKEITFDGSSDEAWSLNTVLTGVNRFAITISDAEKSNDNTILNQCKCNYFDTSTSMKYGNANYVKNLVYIYDKVAYFYTDPEEFPDLASWKNWLDSNNVKLQYKTGVETPIQIELPNIPTLKGTTILSVDTKIQPSNAEVIYMGKP